MNFAKGGLRLDNNLLMMILLVLVFFPDILGMFGDNMLIYLVLFLILTGGFGI